MNNIHNNDVNNIAEFNLPHDISYTSKRIKLSIFVIPLYYMDV